LLIVTVPPSSSISTGCFDASTAVAKTLSAVHRFIRDVREARADLDPIANDLHSLNNVLDLLKEDAARYPAHLAHQTPALLDNCLAILAELEGCLSVLNRPDLSRDDRKSRWMGSRQHITKLRWTLDGYKSTIGLAVDLVAL